MSDLMYLGAVHFDGDPGELLGQCRPGVAFTRAVGEVVPRSVGFEVGSSPERVI